MNILYDYEIFSIQKYGGATRYFYEIISRMPKYENCRVNLYMGRYINTYGLEGHKDKFDNYYGKKIRHIPRTKLLFIKAQKPFFERYANRYSCDIFHKTYYQNYNLKPRKKTIITLHDFTHERFPDNFSKLDKTPEYKRRSISEANGIICISESTKRDLLEYYKVPEEKIKIIYHGNSLKYTVTEDRIIKEPYILYVGDRRSYKNFGILIDAFNNSDFLRKNFKSVCAGGGRFTKKEKEDIEKANALNNFIQIEGRDKLLANLYHYAEVFVFPSLYEGFGIPILEAMHYGCPIIASNSSSLPEVGGNAAVYFNPNSPDDFSEKLLMILNDRELKEKLAKNGINREKNFDWEKTAIETYEFYKQIAE